MKYLLFQDPLKDYGATFDIVLAGALKRGFGAYDEKDAKLLLKLNPVGVSEISEEAYQSLKKKVDMPAVSHKLLKMVAQDPSKDPNAVYAKKEAPAVPSKNSKPAKSLVSVGEAKVEDPLEGKS